MVAVKIHYTPYCAKWVSKCYAYLDIPESIIMSTEQKKAFLTLTAKRHEDWQVNQVEAVL